MARGVSRRQIILIPPLSLPLFPQLMHMERTRKKGETASQPDSLISAMRWPFVVQYLSSTKWPNVIAVFNVCFARLIGGGAGYFHSGLLCIWGQQQTGFSRIAQCQMPIFQDKQYRSVHIVGTKKYIQEGIVHGFSKTNPYVDCILAQVKATLK